MLVPALLLLLSPPPVSSCAVADEPAFGTALTSAIQVGGGAMYAGARERRYLDALRGPEGEPLQYKRTGSRLLDPKDPNQRTTVDLYDVTYRGLDTPIVLYLDACHFHARSGGSDRTGRRASRCRRDQIAYPEGACGAATEIALAIRFTDAKAIKTPMPALPAGQPPTDRPVRLQALLDADGRAQQIVYDGGPAALTAAAIDAVRGWTAEPARLNGTPIIAPVTFQVKFGSQ